MAELLQDENIVRISSVKVEIGYDVLGNIKDENMKVLEDHTSGIIDFHAGDRYFRTDGVLHPQDDELSLKEEEIYDIHEIKEEKVDIEEQFPDKPDILYGNIPDTLNIEEEVANKNYLQDATKENCVQDSHPSQYHLNPIFETNSLNSNRLEINENIGGAQYKCHLCEYSASRKHYLKFHIEGIHMNLKQHKCNFCHFATSNKYRLKTHIEQIHTKSREFSCHLCDYATSKRSHLKLHIDGVHFHLKEFKCHLCDFETSRKSHLKIHINGVHLNLKASPQSQSDPNKPKASRKKRQETHQCQLCDYKASRKYYLKFHFDSVHLNLKKHLCHLCDFGTNNKYHLEGHINTVHTSLRKHKCHLCSFVTNNKTHFNNHVNGVHLNLKKHKCHLCDHATNDKRNLASHIEKIHMGPTQPKCEL